jgi:peptide/nickel transport system ATP-binding protein/peptide/nickel transport system permease protein
MVALDPLYTIGNQIREAVRTHNSISRAEVRARMLELLEMVQIENPVNCAGLYPHEVSGGMAQRVSIAIALAGNPALLIADEPTTALDVTVQKEIIDLLRTLQRDMGMAILVISHDWGVIAEMCDRVVVMYAGQAMEYGTLAEVISQPFHPYTMGLLRANPHLAVAGEPLPTIPGTVPKPEEWPLGCHFLGRCPYARTACAESAIRLGAFEQGRLVRCIRADEVRERGDS